MRVSVTDKHGNMFPLIPADYQCPQQHQHAPLFRITAISWDGGALRTISGYRTRQAATVTVTQYTPLTFVKRSVAQRTATIPTKTAGEAMSVLPLDPQTSAPAALAAV